MLCSVCVPSPNAGEQSGRPSVSFSYKNRQKLANRPMRESNKYICFVEVTGKKVSKKKQPVFMLVHLSGGSLKPLSQSFSSSNVEGPKYLRCTYVHRYPGDFDE